MRTGVAYGNWVVTILCAVFLTALGIGLAGAASSGELTIIDPDGKPVEGCPLQHTSVKAEVSGFVARVSVTQIFRNPMKKKIEAVYTFPLSADGAVDSMVMRVGDRVVRGLIKRREEARRIYERAREKGHVASLLDQERPNIFTQHVANIMPQQKVEITIRYVELLPYDDGAFKFVFPMVVGPRFIPGRPTGKRDRILFICLADPPPPLPFGPEDISAASQARLSLALSYPQKPFLNPLHSEAHPRS